MAVESRYQLDIMSLSEGHLEMYLGDYETQVEQLPEWAEEWASLDEEERMHYEAEFDLALGRRLVLEEVLGAGRLTREQEAALERVDRLAEMRRDLIRALFGTEVEELLGRVAFASRERSA